MVQQAQPVDPGARVGALIAQINKDYGKGAIMQPGGAPVEPVEVVPTGSLSLDAALGVGGYPRGRIVEVYGPESSGKTTLTLHAIANAQRDGGVAAFVDAEHALDIGYARALGVHTDSLLISQPDSGEQALGIVDDLVRSGAVDVVVVDSVAALVPKDELDGDMGDSHMGLQARLMSQAMRKLVGNAHRTGTLVMFINQLRQKIGVVFGNPETTTGGNALKFYASVRLDVRRVGIIKEAGKAGADPVPVGSRTKVKVVKNKCAPPFRETEFDVLYGRGVSRAGDVLDMAAQVGVVEKSGAWMSFAGERLGQGRDNVRSVLELNPQLLAQLESAVRAKLFA